MTTTTDLRRTPLHEAHRRAGAKLVPFAGYEMPVSYRGVSEEHIAVRERAGMFDVSHMGEVETQGPQAAALLQRALSNDVEAIDLGGAQYSVLCREDGGILDDLFTYRLGEQRYLTVTNASNAERDYLWLAEQAEGFEAEVSNAGERYAMLAVQGPEARGLVAEIAEGELPARMRVAELRLAGATALVCGTGYTGEDGVELLLDPDHAPEVWSALLEAGVEPAGLGARDTLRLEVCFHLYGNDISEDRDPIEAGLGWCCKEHTGFVGAEAVARAREAGARQRLVPFVLTERGIPRQGNPVRLGSEQVGTVTSGTHSPSMQVGIGMGYVRSELAEPGTELEIDVRGRRRAARVESKPLYRKES